MYSTEVEINHEGSGASKEARFREVGGGPTTTSIGRFVSQLASEPCSAWSSEDLAARSRGEVGSDSIAVNPA